MDGCMRVRKWEVESRMGCYDNLEKDAKEHVHHAIDECIQCFRCEAICPPDVIQIEARVPASLREGLGLAPKGEASRPEPVPAIDLGRRRVIASLGAGMFWGATAKASAGNYQGPMRR